VWPWRTHSYHWYVSVYSLIAQLTLPSNRIAQDASGPHAFSLQIQIYGKGQVEKASAVVLLQGPSAYVQTTSEVNITKIPPRTPILFLSGAQDEIVPPAHMKELYEQSKTHPDAQRTFVLFEKGGHSEFYSWFVFHVWAEQPRYPDDTWQQPNYRKALRDFVNAVTTSYLAIRDEST